MQYQRASPGGLFADMPSGLDYDEIVALTCNKKVWKNMTILAGEKAAIRKLIERARRTLIVPRKPPPKRRRLQSTPTSTEPPNTPAMTPVPPKMTMMNLKWNKAAIKNKKKKKKSLTDKERAAWTREYYRKHFPELFWKCPRIVPNMSLTFP